MKSSKKIIDLVLQILLGALCLSALYKVINYKPGALSSSHSQPKKQNFSNTNFQKTRTPSYTQKKLVSISHEQFCPQPDQVDLEEGKTYILLESFNESETKERCVLGFFQLVKKRDHDFLFTPISSNQPHSQLQTYAATRQLNVFIEVLSTKQSEKLNILPCHQWFLSKSF